MTDDLSDADGAGARSASDVSTDPPLLRVIHGGTPEPDELAALVTVVALRSASSPAEPARSLRRPLPPWVASGLVKGTRTRV